MKRKTALGLGGLGLLVVASAALGAAVGSTVIDLPAALWELLAGEASSPDARILLHVRLPRVCASLLCGSALAVSGMLIQAVLSNPLASPNVIGVNAGAGFCTFLAMAIAPGMAGAAPLGAFIGALTATLLVYAVAAGAGAGKLTIILAGVTRRAPKRGQRRRLAHNEMGTPAARGAARPSHSWIRSGEPWGTAGLP